MSWTIRIMENAAGLPCPEKGLYVVAMDVEARDGLGQATLSPNRDRAMRFNTAADAHNYWSRPSKTHPRRPDGKPNRPLTAFTVAITRT